MVATPGRLLDLVDHNALRLAAVETLVLDEADRLLDLGFAEELARVLALLPARRQNLLFSATFPPAVQALATQLLHEPLRIEVAGDAAEPSPTSHSAPSRSTPAGAPSCCATCSNGSGWPRVLVFVATKHAAEHVADKLRKAGIAAEPFHGELSQGTRTPGAGRLQGRPAAGAGGHRPGGARHRHRPAAGGGELRPAALGRRLRAPHRPHRPGGRTRAGASASSRGRREAHFRLIEKRQGLRVPRERIAGFEPVEVATAPPATSPDTAGGIKGKRKSKKDKLRAAAALEAAARAGAAP